MLANSSEDQPSKRPRNGLDPEDKGRRSDPGLDGADDLDAENWFEDLVEEMEDSMDRSPGPESIPVEPVVAKQIQDDLIAEGPRLFIQKYLIADPKPFAPSKLLAALGFPLSRQVAEEHGERRLELMLQIAMKHFMSQRRRLPEPRTLDDVVELIKKSRNIIVLSGAGISTSLGIPDFRSDDGLYAQLKHLGLDDPQEVFDIDLFRQDPQVFYSVAAKILPQETRFSPTHQFIKLLYDKGKLLRNYTQNIDNLEAAAGIPPEKLVQCHGSFGLAYCFSCFHKVPGESLYPQIRRGEVPRCPKCTRKKIQMEKREHDVGDESFGVYKPDITFFGEQLPTRFDDMLLGNRGDARKCDLLICIGTSLKVQPVASIVRVVDRSVPQVYISKTPARHCSFDVSLLGPCDDVVELLCAKLGWKLDHPMAKRPPDLADTEYPGGTIASHDGVYEFS